MKTEFTRSNKDNISIATLLSAGLIALATGVFTSGPAVAKHTGMEVQQLDPIVVTASRAADFTLDTIVVTGSRKTALA